MKAAVMIPILLGLVSSTVAAQIPLGWQANDSAIAGGSSAGRAPHDDQLSNESSPSSIAADTFTTLTHPDFKEHKVRIKNTTGWCDPNVHSYTGYIDAGSRSFFFYFFESRRDPHKDDLIMWTNGGPGVSSSLGAFMELGACSIISANETKVNKHSWNEVANILFVDQPIGVGFSYSTSETIVGTSEQAAVDIHAFLSIFTGSFEGFKGRALHLAGESYGGRYLPVMSSEIVYQNQKLADQNDSTRTPLNLKSVLIGNGLTDFVSMTVSYYEQACSSKNAIGRPVLDIKACMAMQEDVKRCDKWLTRACRDHLAQPDCDAAVLYCQAALETPINDAQVNPYDISRKCTTLYDDLCFPELNLVKLYLDQPSIREKLGVDPRIGNYTAVASSISSAFDITRDTLAPTYYHLTGLLEEGVRVLIYVGQLDWICNYIGNKKMLEDLEWSGAVEYRVTKLRQWKMDGEVKGETKTTGNLTYLDVEGAGHMVPREKPKEALEMLKRWLAHAEM